MTAGTYNKYRKTQLAAAVSNHVTVKDDLDVVALEGEMIKSLRF